MELPSGALLWKLLLLESDLLTLLSPPGPSGSPTAGSSVVSESAVSCAAGTQAVLRCQSPRMVWTQDRLHDRQRVVHWDLSGGPGGPARRLVDMYSAGEQRVYEPRDRGRLLLSPSAFHDGNFSLLIRAVEEGDEGLYTCNLHPHYCHLHETKEDQAPYRSEDIQLGRPDTKAWAGEGAPGRTSPCSPHTDYKNNILKERAELAHSPLPAKSIDLHKGEHGEGGFCHPSADPGKTPACSFPGPQIWAPASPTGRRPSPSLLRSLRSSVECLLLVSHGMGQRVDTSFSVGSRVQERVLQVKGAWAPGWPAALPWRMSPDLAMLTGLLPSGWPACFPGTWSRLARVAALTPSSRNNPHSPRDSATVATTLWPPLSTGGPVPTSATAKILYVHQTFRPSWLLPARGGKMFRDAQSEPGGLGSWEAGTSPFFQGSSVPL
uniref:Matrix remodeling-associated protein 8 n=1 Tax=Spermophilus dauricus TaxID=99837 RepID=A0A8C9P840_SPEDA